MKVIDSLVIMILFQFQKCYATLDDRIRENEEPEKEIKKADTAYSYLATLHFSLGVGG
jgi:hypothetical protein